MSSETTVRDIMRTIISIDSNAKVRDAARMMVDRNVGSVVVNRGGSPFGIVTERDLVRKIVAQGSDPSKLSVADVMTAPLTIIDASASLIDAARKMGEKRIKRLIVTEHDKIIGIVTQTDLVQHTTDFGKLAKMGMA